MKVVLVEDSAAIRALLVAHLTRQPLISVVGQASAENEALATIALSTPDVVLLDLSLAVGTGLSTMQRLRERGFAGMIYVLSARNREDYERVCLTRGANAYYDKDKDLDQLVADLAGMALDPFMAAKSKFQALRAA